MRGPHTDRARWKEGARTRETCSHEHKAYSSSIIGCSRPGAQLARACNAQLYHEPNARGTAAQAKMAFPCYESTIRRLYLRNLTGFCDKAEIASCQRVPSTYERR